MNAELTGHWSIDSMGRHEFHYDESWAKNEVARPISLSMPLQPPEVPYRGPVVEAYFDNLLPESIEVRKRIRDKFGAASTSVFDLLVETGRDCVGAIQLLPPGQPPRGVDQINGKTLDEGGVADSLRRAVSGNPLGQRDDDDLRISLAGMQEKTALLLKDNKWHEPLGATPTTHIFKLPLGLVGRMQADLSTSVENEWLCAQIVREFGLPVARCDIADFEDQHVLIVERFDRRLSADRADINNLLLGSRHAAADRRLFFRAQVLFWMLCAVDGHAKNFSVFIERYGRFKSTPLYDVISAYPILGNGKNQLSPKKASMAMAVTGKNRHYRWAEIQPRHWVSTANKIGLSATVEEDIADLVARTPGVVKTVNAALPKSFPRGVADPVFDGLTQAAEKLSELG
jgi:serine/threonine-protein kinase HipA